MRHTQLRRAAGRALVLVIALALCAALPARAQNDITSPGAPLIFDTVLMPRSTAMAGAHAAIASSNDALLVNPAGIAQGRRYHAELDGILDPQFPATGVTVSVVDSTSLAVASGLLFSRFGAGQEAGRGSGWLVGAAYAYDLNGIYFGGQTRYIRFNGPLGESHRIAQDFGMLLHRGSFSWALVGRNLSTSTIPYFPPTTTAAISFGTDADYHLAIDYTANLGDTSHVKHKLAGGYELLVEQFVALRTGFAYDFTQNLGFFAVGFGLLSEKGSLQFAYQRRVVGGFDHQFQVGLTLYLE